MNNTATIALVLALGTSLWTWWPQGEIKDTAQAERSQVLTASGNPVKADTVAAVRVVTMDSESKAAKPFEVRREKGQWIIPSHFNYPADGGTRVGGTAGAVLNIPLGPLVTADKKTHGEYGVIDPLSPGSAENAGKRVTLSDEGGAVLVDVIIGKQKAGADVYFVRRATEDTVYTAKVQPDNLKASFKDWVETDLLKVAKDSIREATVKNYSVDEATGTVRTRSTVAVSKPKDADAWRVLPPYPGKVLNTATIDGLTGEAAGLRLVGVRPYSNAWLQERGFYVGREGRQLYGNEGEIQLVGNNGLVHHLFFGEIALGDDADKAAKKIEGAKPQLDAAVAHNRYMAIFVNYAPEFDETIPKPEYPKPGPKKEGETGLAGQAKPEAQPATGAALGKPSNQEAIDKAVVAGKARAQKAQARFQKFFYVVSNDSFKKLRPDRESFYKAPEPPKTEAKTGQ